ncbi:MAG: hypothetical protein Q7S68_00240, partial [Deltaproteobacteria bacterium]|nr:hypothetical protein [Deltaproteobacteria bacterium]
IDPENKFRARFLEKISSLDCVRIFNGEIEATFEVLFSELSKKPSDLLAFATAMTHYFEELLPKSSLANRRKFARLLLDYYQKGIAEPKTQKAVAFWIQYYMPRYHLQRFQPELASLAVQFPPILVPQIPAGQWLEDNTVAARLYFYSDEVYTTDAKEKGDEQKWFEYTQKLLIEKYGWKMEKTVLDSEPKICVLKKEMGQATLKIILTLQEEEKAPQPLPDEGFYESIVHRGHYNPLGQTFPVEGNKPFPPNDIPRLMYLGACKSMSYAATEEFQRAYADDIIISDLNVSLGTTSTEFISKLMTDIALRRTTWDRYKKYQRVDKMVLPDSPISLIGRYLVRNP